jgi:hypothetical protein
MRIQYESRRLAMKYPNCDPRLPTWYGIQMEIRSHKGSRRGIPRQGMVPLSYFVEFAQNCLKLRSEDELKNRIFEGTEWMERQLQDTGMQRGSHWNTEKEKRKEKEGIAEQKLPKSTLRESPEGLIAWTLCGKSQGCFPVSKDGSCGCAPPVHSTLITCT